MLLVLVPVLVLVLVVSVLIISVLVLVVSVLVGVVSVKPGVEGSSAVATNISRHHGLTGRNCTLISHCRVTDITMQG